MEIHTTPQTQTQNKPKPTTSNNTPLYRLHIFKLVPPTDKEELKVFFSQFGPVKSISLKKSRNKRRCGQAKLTVENQETYEKLLKIKNFEFLGGSITVERFLSKKDLDAKEEDIALKRVIIFNLSKDIVEEDLKKFVEQYGKVVNFYIVQKMKKIRGHLEMKRYAMVTFDRAEDAHEIKKVKVLKFLGRVLFASAFISRRNKGEMGPENGQKRPIHKRDEVKVCQKKSISQGKKMENCQKMMIKNKSQTSAESNMSGLRLNKKGLKIDRIPYQHDMNGLRLNRPLQRSQYAYRPSWENAQNMNFSRENSQNSIFGMTQRNHFSYGNQSMSNYLLF